MLQLALNEILGEVRRLEPAQPKPDEMLERLGLDDKDALFTYHLTFSFGPTGEAFVLSGRQAFYALLQDEVLPEATEQVQAYLATQLARPFVAKLQALIQRRLQKDRQDQNRQSRPPAPRPTLHELPERSLDYTSEPSSSSPTDQPAPPPAE